MDIQKSKINFAFDSQISVHINRDYFVMAFPIRGGSLARRSYLHAPSLRSTTAWAMASLAQLQAGDVVLDPMCGSGTTLIEAAMDRVMPAAAFVGADLSADQIRLSCENIAHAKLKNKIQVNNQSDVLS